MRKGVGGIPGQFVRAEPANAGGIGNGWQPGSKAETVRQPGQVVTPLWELPLTAVLTQCKLPPQGSGAHQYAVRFHPGTVDGLPTPQTTGLLNPCKQRRTVTLHPLIQSWSGMSKMQLRAEFHQLQGGAECAFSRLPGVRDRPQPGQVQMGMTDPVHSTCGTRLT